MKNILILIILFTLSACGGGGGGGDSGNNDQQPSEDTSNTGEKAVPDNNTAPQDINNSNWDEMMWDQDSWA